MSATPSYHVFADVDHTLIQCASMIAFMEFWLSEPEFASTPAAARLRREFSALKQAHASGGREALNRRYYAMFEGVRAEGLQAAARRWSRAMLDGGRLFIEPVCRELAAHQAAMAAVVLVSGSFFELLDPIKSRIGARELLCTELEVASGAYTGRLRQQVIGDGKWQVILRYLSSQGRIRLEDCYAYGDHISDVCFMEKVGHPVVVGDSPAMRELAERRRWRVIPATPGERPR
jgi:HAD superfamily hydrolase (TIGR01490 family)